MREHHHRDEPETKATVRSAPRRSTGGRWPVRSEGGRVAVAVAVDGRVPLGLSVKRRQQVATLVELLGSLEEERCLLLTQGAAGAELHEQLRSIGGRWSWAELDPESAARMESVLGEPVALAEPQRLPYSDAAFDRIVVATAGMRRARLAALALEVARTLSRYGVAIVNAPAPESAAAVAAIRRWLGRRLGRRRPHVSDYSLEDLERALVVAGLQPLVFTEYSRVFTELAEVGFELASAEDPAAEHHFRSNGGGAPGSGRIRRLALPVLRAISALDVLAAHRPGHAVAIAAMKRG
jgi:hypothetical protein